MTNLSRRVSKLEQSEWLTGPRSVMERFTAAFDEAASRLTARCGLAVTADGTAMDCVVKEVADGIFSRLNESEREDLIENLLQIGYGDDTAAKEAARQAATRRFMAGDGRRAF